MKTLFRIVLFPQINGVSDLNKLFRIISAVFFILCCGSQIYAANKSVEVFSQGKAKIYLDMNLDGFPGGKHHLNASTIADFKQYFKEITGKTLPTAAANGLIPLRAEVLPAKQTGSIQDCIIDVSPRAIVLKASDSLGIINGLYMLLDQWGCRWVMPGKMGEVIPRKSALSLPVGQELIKSGFDSRVESSWRQGKDHPDWRRRNRRAAKQWLSAQHYWLYAIPPSKYFTSHPEYYALIGGKRRPTQLCTTNPEVRELMVKKALEYFKKRPTAASFPMDPADNFDHCQCENCKKLDNPGEISKGYPCVSNRVAAFANYVAKRIAETYPDKKIGFYAYANKKLPPTIKLHKNIFVPYTRDSSSLIHLMPDEQVPSSLEYWQSLKKWQQVCSNMYAYEYDPVSWTGSLPCPTYLVRAQALKKQYDMGIKGVINDQGPRGDATLFVNRYMEARFRTNPDLDPKKELADMCNKFFGPAGKAMNQYYLSLAKVTECKDDIRFGIAGYDQLFTPQMIKNARNYLNQALAIGKKSDAMIQKRLEMVNLSQNYLEQYLHFIWNLKKRDYKLSCKDAAKIYDAIDKLGKENKFYLETVDAKRRITTAVKKNMAKVFYKQMGFIRNWQLVGPFNNNKRDGVVVAKPLTVKNDKFYLNKQLVKAKPYISPEGFIDFRAAFKQERAANNVYYAYAVTTVNSRMPQIAQLRTDSFNPFKIWLNGRLVYYREGLDADCPDKRQVNIRLLAGKNIITVMVAQNHESPLKRWGFWLRITDSKGKLIDLSKPVEISQKDRKLLKAALIQAGNGSLKNLIPRPDFEGLKNLKDSTFGVWPKSIKPNVILCNSKALSGKTSVKFTNIKSGSLNRFFKVKPGEKYLAGFDCYNTGGGLCGLTVSWRAKGVFMAPALKRCFFPSGKAEWTKVAGILTVPAGADQLVYCIAVSSQSPQDSCFVDNLFLYKLKK